ncbi:MAG: P83/100 family protein [Leptospira sp.]|nr:P83/100 family protein [Leptospira sp.]
MRIFRAATLLVFVVALGLSAQTKAPLGESEIKGAKRIEFINRSYKRATNDIVQENQEMGKKLAQGIDKDGNIAINGVSIQRIQPGQDGKLGADILTISESQSFDHVNSIVRIVSSYVETAFQYKSGSDTLGQYLVYYNAAHRKDLKYFSGKYSAEVIKVLSADKVGLDTNFKNWSGKTQLIIPIEKNILKDGGKDVTTDELEKEVNKIVKDKEKDPDTKKKMQEEAKKMDTLQTEKIKEEKKIVQEKKQEVAKEQQVVEQKKEEIKKKEATEVAKLNELKKDPVKNKDEIVKKTEEVKQIQQEVAKTEAEAKVVEAKKEELDKKEEQLAAKEEARKEGGDGTATTATGDGTKTEATKTEEAVKVAEQKVEALKTELSEVKEELKKKEEQSDNVINNKILFMKFIKYDADGHYSNELWAIDTTKDDTLFRSPYNNICSKDFKEIANQGVLVLGYDGEKVETRKHKLVLLDPDKLAVKKTSEAADIFWRTPMVNRDDKIYVIEKFQDKYHVSRFKSDLTFEARTAEGIEENSEITFFGEKIYVTGKPKEGEKNTIKIFKKEDLSLIKTITP